MTTATLQRDVNVSTTMRQTLHELAIDPFTYASVRSYKEEQLAKNKWRDVWHKRCENITDGLFCTSAVGMAMMLVVIIAMSFCWLLGVVAASHIGLGAMAGAVVISLMVLTSLSASGIGSRLKVSPQWDKIRLADYKHPIPEFVLQTVADVREKHPSCSFYVDALTFRTRPCDPFLVVWCGDEGRELYIEVWNESYQKQREV